MKCVMNNKTGGLGLVVAMTATYSYASQNDRVENIESQEKSMTVDDHEEHRGPIGCYFPNLFTLGD